MRKLVPQTSALTGLRYAPTEKAFSHQDLASDAGQGSNAEPGTERTQAAYTGPQSPGQVPKSFPDGSPDPARNIETGSTVLSALEGRGTVFTADEVRRLWRHQFGPWSRPFQEQGEEYFPRMHPFTCDNRSDHPVVAGDKGILVPTIRGWICPFCDYKQDWAHGFMKRPLPSQTEGGNGNG